MELELKHLRNYLGYNLKCSMHSELFPSPVLTGINGIFAYLNYHGANLSFEIEKIKPLLRPLSGLTKEIEINGKKFVPIVELAKIEANGFKLIVSFGVGENEYQEVDSFCEYIDEFGHNVLLFRSSSLSMFSALRGSFSDSPRNQLELFEKLFEWHFDVFGLIDEGLALPLI